MLRLQHFRPDIRDAIQGFASATAGKIPNAIKQTTLLFDTHCDSVLNVELNMKGGAEVANYMYWYGIHQFCQIGVRQKGQSTPACYLLKQLFKPMAAWTGVCAVGSCRW